MISAFEVYLVMQLDTIGNALVTTAVLLGIAAAAATMCGASYAFDEFNSKADVERKHAAFAIAKKFFFAFVVVGFFSVVIPSTKTAAAMIVLPAITSNEVVEPLAEEGKALYRLAKQALADTVEKSRQAPAPEPEE